MKNDFRIDLGVLFSSTSGTEVLSFQKFSRHGFWLDEQIALVRDGYPDFGADCTFIRLASEYNLSCRLELSGGYRIATCVAGGRLLRTEASALPLYWIPQPPVIRSLDDQHASRQNFRQNSSPSPPTSTCFPPVLPYLQGRCWI